MGIRGIRGIWAAWVVLLTACGAVEEGAEPPPEPSTETRGAALLGETRWVRRSVGASSDAEVGRAVAVDREGNVIVALSYEGPTRVGTLDLPRSGRPDDNNLGLVKYSPSGKVLWARGYFVDRAFAGDVVAAEGVAVDRQGNIYVTGRSLGPVDFGGGLVPGGGFLLKLGPTGGFKRARALVTGTGAASPSGLAVDRKGNVVVVGAFQGTVDFGGGPLTSTPLEFTAFIARYDASGDFQWARGAVGTSRSAVRDVVIDERGDLYVTTFFAGTADFGGGALSTSEDFSGAVVKYRPSGAHVWTRMPGPRALLEDLGVHGNRVVVAGSARGAFSFGGKTSTFATPTGLVFAYTRDGEARWLRPLGLSGPVALTVDPSGGVTVVGFSRAGEDLGGGPLPGSGIVSFILRLERVHGGLRWALPFESDLGVDPHDVAASKAGDPVITGSFAEPEDFGTGTALTPNGLDLFLLRLEP